MAQPSLGGWRARLSPIIFLSHNWLSRIGVYLVSAAGIFWLVLLPTFLQGHAASAYMGILLFLILPMAFFAGLGLIPLGMFLYRKRLRDLPERPPLTWKSPDLRRFAVFLGIATFANLLIGANLSYRAVEHMESSQFCGATCHTVMKPEYTAYQNSPHSKVECVQCHIGPGASWFVQSKLSGSWQVISVMANLYPRPIPTPVKNLRPARDTCEGCHWPDKYGGDRLRVLSKYSEKGELTKTVLLMKIGGGSATGSGIHTAHVGKGVSIRYAHSDESRQTIPWVEYTRNGESREYMAPKTSKENIGGMPIREMDCMDCHTRPSHTFETAETAIDNAMVAGQISPALPEVKKNALAILQKPYASTEEAEREVPAAMLKIYGKDGKAGESAARAVLGIWQRNVFPEMKVTWGTYPNNIGHTDFPGCFRCHDGEHNSKDGKSVEQDCNACHQLLAMDEKDPKILNDLGITQ